MLARFSNSVSVGTKCCALLDGACTRITLKKELGFGATAHVFLGETKAKEQYAVKIYKDEYRNEHLDELWKKLHSLLLAQAHFIASAQPAFAWPLAIVHRGTKSSDLRIDTFVGFIMRLEPHTTDFFKIAERAEQHGLPLSHRIGLAHFLAKGFAMLHEGVSVKLQDQTLRMAFAIADADDKNIQVIEKKDDLVVLFFDCDSFVVRVGSEVLKQGAIPAKYPSPEYLSASDRTKYVFSDNDDNFTLAVLLFRFLNDWQFPFYYDGSADKSQLTLIRERRFPFARGSKDEPLPSAKGVAVAYRANTPAKIKSLFERAFLPGRERPRAAEWASALLDFLLSQADVKQAKSRPRRPAAAGSGDHPSRPAPTTTAESPSSAAPTPTTSSSRGIGIAIVVVIAIVFLLYKCNGG